MTAHIVPDAAAIEAGPGEAVTRRDPPPARDGTNDDRISRLGSGDIAAVMNLAPATWRVGSPFSLWCYKVGLLIEDERDVSEEMEFGQFAEPMLAAYVHDRTGMHVAGEQMRYSRPGDDSWMTCSIDGLIVDDYEHEWTVPSIDDLDVPVFEAKTTGDAPSEWEHPDHPYDDHRALRRDGHHGVPAEYAAQATWISIVTGHPVVWFGVLHFPFRRRQFRLYEFIPDAEDKALVEKKAREFWGYVVRGEPPPVDSHPSTATALGQAWDAIDGETVEADELDVFTVEELRRLKAEAKKLDEQITLRENAIKARLGEATVLTGGVDAKHRPVVLATWKSAERRSFDHKALLAHRAADDAERSWWDLYLARFQTKTATRTLLVKSPKGDS